MADFKREVCRLLQDAGWYKLKGLGKGSHERWANRDSPETKITIPAKLKGRHLANRILKSAGIKKTF